ncbi:MAG: alginate export family protein [Opitutaceae bacterium]|nr:alginate export family protein [Opitutaceae bacterium]
MTWIRPCRNLPALASTTLLLAAYAGAANEPARSFSDALEQGKATLAVRARFEGVEQSGLRDAEALTLRTRLGFTSAPWQGWIASVEVESIAALDGDRYNQAGLNPGAADRAVVADPTSSEINQAFLNATLPGNSRLTLGRQRLVFDQARFIGDVGWRQNQQTFDALALQSKGLEKTTLTYTYLHRIHRVFGDRHPQGNWKSASHLLHGSRSGLPAAGTLAAYAYLLDFETAAANSCATLGASYSGTLTRSSTLTMPFRIEAAHQTDHGASPLTYSTHYLAAEAGIARSSITLSLGAEWLGSDRQVGFKTPLATLHAFNGWADLFLTTPGAGLRDTYFKVVSRLPASFAVTGFFHDFETAQRARLGTETDLMVTKPIGKSVTATAKFATFSSSSPTYPDVRKLWLQVEFIH